MTVPVFCAEPQEALADLLKNEYHNGTVGVVGPAPETLCRRLAANGNAVEREGRAFGEHVRAIVGIGDYKDILRARKVSVERRLILLPAIVDKICYIPKNKNRASDIKYSVPENIIYPYRVGKPFRTSALACLLGLLAECVDLAASKPQIPTFVTLAKEIRKMLAEPIEPVSVASFCAGASTILTAAGGRLYDELSFLPGRSADSVFFTNYLITAAFIQFTKMDFNGIFIGKERAQLVCRAASERRLSQTAAFSKSGRGALMEALPSADELSGFARRYLWDSGSDYFKTNGASAVWRRLLEAEERTADNGLLASLCRIGYIDKFK